MKCGKVAPAANNEMTVVVTIVFEKNILMYFIFSCGSSIVCKNMINEKIMLYANFPGTIGNKAGI